MTKAQRSKLTRRTKRGSIVGIINKQRKSSKTRGHPEPAYTNQELIDWCMNQDVFHVLHAAWIESDYDIWLKPSIDRLEDNLGYTFDNIKIVTWKENNDKSHRDTRSGKLRNQLKPIAQYSLDGTHIADHISASEAARTIKFYQANISKACNKQAKTAGGFLWKYI